MIDFRSVINRQACKVRSPVPPGWRPRVPTDSKQPDGTAIRPQVDDLRHPLSYPATATSTSMSDSETDIPDAYRDPLFDAPNTTIDETLDAKLHLYERASQAFAEGTRFEADLTAEHLRDRFGIDYRRTPQPVHPKVLSRPLSRGVDDVPVVVVVGNFATIDAAQIRRPTASRRAPSRLSSSTALTARNAGNRQHSARGRKCRVVCDGG